MKDICPWCGAKARTNKNCELCTGIELTIDGKPSNWVAIPKKRCVASVTKLTLIDCEKILTTNVKKEEEPDGSTSSSGGSDLPSV